MSDDVITGRGLQLIATEVKDCISSRLFGMALCRHLGLNANRVSADFKVTTAPDEIFGVTLHYALTADDLAAIAKTMEDDE